MEIAGKPFVWGRRTFVMAILNVTPDSFSGDGLGRDVATIVDAAAQAVADGADILDVGGESTRPGAVPVAVDEELARVVPAIEAVSRRFDTVVSVDSSKAQVARAALAAGAHMVNDVWGLQADPAMAGVVAESGAAVVIMHNASDPKNAEILARLGGHYVDSTGVDADVVQAVGEGLRQAVQQALAAGVAPGSIILDPGIGFGKTVAQNLELVDRTAEIGALGYPVLVGPSRKSFIGLTLDAPPEDRMEGTAAAVAIAIARGADIVRVHDVRQMVRVARMSDALVRR